MSEPRLGCASQKEIGPNRVILFSACAVYYDLDFGLVVQFLWCEYTAKYRDTDDLVSNVSPFVGKEDMKQMVRVFDYWMPPRSGF